MSTHGIKRKHEHEREFHDEWAESLDVDELMVRESFEAATAVENRYALESFGNLRNKKLLDVGCGAGETSVYFALQGAEVHAIDISPKMINVVESLAEKFHVRVESRVMKAEALEYDDATFDFVFGNGVLHHVELEPAVGEIRRVLRPGGMGIFIEPLGYNPVIEVYRLLAKTVRTETEKPFRFNKLKVFRRYFDIVEHKEFWLLTLSVFLYFYFVERSDPSKDRYWKKVIKDSKKYESTFNGLLTIDEILLKALPFLRRFCWNTVIKLK